MNLRYILLVFLESYFSQRIDNSTGINTEEAVFVSSAPVSEFIVKVGCLSLLINIICKQFQNVTETINEEKLPQKYINMMEMMAVAAGFVISIVSGRYFHANRKK